jgi:hypothetical protein
MTSAIRRAIPYAGLMQRNLDDRSPRTTTRCRRGLSLTLARVPLHDDKDGPAWRRTLVKASAEQHVENFAPHAG